MPLRQSDREKAAFVSEFGLFQWTRMPYGLCNSPPTFQRTTTIVFKDLVQWYGSIVMCYIVDIVIATETAEEHLRRLRDFMTYLSNAGLKLNPKKMQNHEGLDQVLRSYC